MANTAATAASNPGDSGQLACDCGPANLVCAKAVPRTPAENLADVWSPIEPKNLADFGGTIEPKNLADFGGTIEPTNSHNSFSLSHEIWETSIKIHGEAPGTT